MYRRLEQRLRCLLEGSPRDLLASGLKGLEKESLRVDPEGRIAMTPHPPCLGSALTHPSITTDFSEALLEFITAPAVDIPTVLSALDDIHRYTYSCIGDELLWATSMPCVLAGEASIPIADYGTSNVGRMKHVYRRGLSWRYGRVMQTISGTHFNYSLPEAIWPQLVDCERGDPDLRQYVDDAYFGLIRNFQRLSWLVPYLFGASPAICRSFAPQGMSGFATLDASTLYRPHATSLRMSDIGYKNDNQAGLGIGYNSLNSYVRSLMRAISTSSPDYERIGTEVDGEWRQLNTNLLQIENEYYSFVRPKQIAESGEKPTLALQQRGVAYVEIRALDVDINHPLGLSEETMRFMETFLILCTLMESAEFDDEERAEIELNQRLAACCGRQPGLALHRDGEAVPLRDWGKELCDVMAPIAEALDAAVDGEDYLTSLAAQRDKLVDPESTPSANILQAMRDRDEGFYQYAMSRSRDHADALRARPLADADVAEYRALAETSLREQGEIESSDSISFDGYLADYFGQCG